MTDSLMERIKRMFRKEASSVERVAEGETPAATPPPGAAAGIGDSDRETSTNAQMEGAADEPWGGNR
jgi:hypothetical protein